jgi:CRISPR-associated protein Csb2
MSDWFSLSVSFHAGRYHGEEWPPSPARVFQALLAGVMTGGFRSRWDAVRSTFEWIERQAPPEIVATEAGAGKRFVLAVPNNDADVAANAWTRGQEFNLAQLRTMKRVSPKEIDDPERKPHLQYLWRIDERDRPDESALQQLAYCLHTLGWGIDMAWADAAVIGDTAVRALSGERWLPADSAALMLPTPVEGSLDDIRAAYERFKKRISAAGLNPDTRFSVYALQPYRSVRETTRPYAAFRLHQADGDGDFSADWRDAMKVSAWLRHASGKAMESEGRPRNWIDGYVLGHVEEGDRNQRLSFVPLPTIGHPHSDGRIRRALILDAPDGDGKAVRLLQDRLAGEELTDDHSNGVCRLGMRDWSGVWRNYLSKDGSHVWQSVTPLLLHGHNTMRGEISLRKTERLILQAFEESGYKTEWIENLAFQAAPMWRGAGSARSVRVPAHLERWPRYHVEVRFRNKVRGPVIAGIGRHCGIGLFAAREEK